MNAVRVMLYHPRWNIPCGVCEAWLFTKEGRLHRDAAGNPTERGGLPTPCGTCPKVPQHLRELYPDDVVRLRAAADELTPANRRFWTFYNECKAVGWTSGAGSDPVVRFLAGGLREVEDRHARDAADRSHESNVILLGLLAKRVAR